MHGQRLFDGSDDLQWLGHAAGPEFAAGHLAVIGTNEHHAVFFQEFGVAFHRCALPHPQIHRRRHQHALVGRQQGGRGQVVRQPVRHFGHQIGGGRRHHHQVGAARQLDMAHLRFVGQAEKIAIDFLPGQRRDRERGDKLRARFGEDGARRDATLSKTAHQLEGFVRRDAAADDQKDAFAAHEKSTLVEWSI